MKKVTTLFITVMLCSCSGIEFNTNLGAYVGSKVKTKGVKEYSLEEIDQYDATPLGFIEASYCQEKPGERKPTRRALVNDLKVKAHGLGGNGIVVESCGKSVAAICQLYMECRGLAYAVPERKGSP
ncbi:hypothetical protein [Microbulbifer rhizosphaerae]|uniref:RcsF protein n=1 Tax=Microbulbifer rhizosphaerae TaxID=1562603 RepID=A0A7W4ZB71_9GAMM|nr:hypothetical protein [Microbulbifer rhizosphaerae]MBB3063597.1 hypothetical protein [Microbulbifer rhizosphaerae]